MLREALELQILEEEPEKAAATIGSAVADHGASAVAQVLLDATSLAFRRMVAVTDDTLDLAELLTRLAARRRRARAPARAAHRHPHRRRRHRGRHPPVGRRAAHAARRAGPPVRRVARPAHRAARRVARDRGHRGRGHGGRAPRLRAAASRSRRRSSGTSTTRVPGRQSGRRSTTSPEGAINAAMPGKSSSTVEPAWVAIATHTPSRCAWRRASASPALPHQLEAGAPAGLVGAPLVEAGSRGEQHERLAAAVLASHVWSTWLSAQMIVPSRTPASCTRAVSDDATKPSSSSPRCRLRCTATISPVVRGHLRDEERVVEALADAELTPPPRRVGVDELLHDVVVELDRVLGMAQPHRPIR